jgi:hypothetical protein
MPSVFHQMKKQPKKNLTDNHFSHKPGGIYVASRCPLPTPVLHLKRFTILAIIGIEEGEGPMRGKRLQQGHGD